MARGFAEALNDAISLAPDAGTREKLRAVLSIRTPHIEEGLGGTFDVMIGEYYIVQISRDGLKLYEDVGDETGLKLDKCGRAVVGRIE
jgi:hypothetical protein